MSQCAELAGAKQKYRTGRSSIKLDKINTVVIDCTSSSLRSGNGSRQSSLIAVSRRLDGPARVHVSLLPVKKEISRTGLISSAAFSVTVNVSCGIGANLAVSGKAYSPAAQSEKSVCRFGIGAVASLLQRSFFTAATYTSLPCEFPLTERTEKSPLQVSHTRLATEKSAFLASITVSIRSDKPRTALAYYKALLLPSMIPTQPNYARRKTFFWQLFFAAFPASRLDSGMTTASSMGSSSLLYVHLQSRKRHWWTDVLLEEATCLLGGRFPIAVWTLTCLSVCQA